MNVHTAVPDTHASPSAAARAAIAAALADIPVTAVSQERVVALAEAAREPAAPRTWAEIAAEMTEAAHAFNDGCSVNDSVKFGREQTEEEDAEYDRLSDRDLKARAAAYAYEPSSWAELVAKSATLSHRLFLEVDGDRVVAALTRDIAGLAARDSDLVAQAQEALRLSAIYRAAEEAESRAWHAWWYALPQAPEDLKVRGIDHLLPVSGLARSVFWGAAQIEALRVALPELQRRSATCHPDSRLPQALIRAEQLVTVYGAHEAAKAAPQHIAAEERFEAAQAIAGEASDSAELVEDAVRAAPASTVTGLAAKARLLLRSYTRSAREEPPETWTEQITRTFLEQVIAADEAAI